MTEHQPPEYMPHGAVTGTMRELTEARAQLEAARQRIRALEGAIRDLVAPADRAIRLVEGRT